MTARLWINVQISQVTRSEWIAYIPEVDDTVTGTTKAQTEQAAYAYLEAALGLKSFTIIWNEF